MQLCQRDRASCGACCGLYNRPNLSREAIREELARRTRTLAGLPRTASAFRAARAALDAGAPRPLFTSVRICALLGFLDGAETRIGCLAHPGATGGVDLRDCGAYDSRTCEQFLCPSHAWLSEEEAAIVETACADAHLYGLVVTDVPFLRAVVDAVSLQTGARVELRHLEEPGFRAALKRLLALKEELAPGSEGLFGAFVPGPSGENLPRRIDYHALGRDRSPHDTILVCVGADPRSGNDLDGLEGEVRRRLDSCRDAFPLR